MSTEKTLIIVTGPTGSGKTALAIELANHIGAEIIGADSRQIYRGIEITTAAPTAAEKAMVRHHLVGFLDLDRYYSAAMFEYDALRCLNELWHKGKFAIICGGSMMYIDAVANGIDEMPSVCADVRKSVLDLYESQGLDAVLEELRRLDPIHAEQVDIRNPRRVIHAVEVSRQAGVPYSSLLTGNRRKRPFRIIKLAIAHQRDELFDRINRRVSHMVEAGMEEEARRVYPLRGLNSLNTVGFKEMFAYFDGSMTWETAIARIAKNTRVYAKKQLTWMKRDPEIIMLDPATAMRDALNAIDKALK